MELHTKIVNSGPLTSRSQFSQKAQSSIFDRVPKMPMRFFSDSQCFEILLTIQRGYGKLLTVRLHQKGFAIL